MPISLPPDGDTSWGDEVRAAISAINVFEGSTPSSLTDRANHTGVQSAASISDFSEAVDDRVATLLVAGSGVSLVYNDAAGTLNVAVTGGSVDAEGVQDIIGAMTSGAGLVSVVYNDTAGTLTISTTATANSADAFLLARGNHTGTQPQSSIDSLVTDLSDINFRFDMIDGVSNIGGVGASQTITPGAGNGTIKIMTLTAPTVTFTFNNPTVPTRRAAMQLVLTQDATGSRTVTWPASVKWPSGTAPTLSTAAGAVDRLLFETFDGGVTWLGSVIGLNYSSGSPAVPTPLVARPVTSRRSRPRVVANAHLISAAP